MKKASINSFRAYSYLHQSGKRPLQYVTIGQLIEKTTEKFGDRPAIISIQQKKKLTYSEALQRCDKLAAGFAKLGLQKGDRVGLWCPNIIEWFITKYAIARAGLVLVALNPAYKANEIEYSINKVGLKCLVCPDDIGRFKFREELVELIPDLEKQEIGNISSKRIPSLKNIVMISEKSQKGAHIYQEIEECNDNSFIEKIRRGQQSISADDAFSILFSSGTTGKPKAAVCSHFSHVNNCIDIGRKQELDIKPHKICMMVPFFHAFGINITTGASVAHGSTIVIPSPTYSPAKNLTAIKEEQCTIIHGTPTMHIDLIVEQKKRNEDIHVEMAVSGGAPISSHQFQTMKDVLKLRSVKSVYGLTETTAMVFSSEPGDDETKSIGTVGSLGNNLEAKVIDSNGLVVPFGTPGELCVRGYPIMKRYWKDEEKTRECLDSDGWLKTGDKFILSEDGYGKIVGRLKEMIIRGGENIFPKEIEDVAITHPHIAEVHVIGLPDERLGEIVCACVKLIENENVKLDLQNLKKFCEGKLSYYKIPSRLEIVDSFPKTTSGKIQKYLLVEKYSAGIETTR